MRKGTGTRHLSGRFAMLAVAACCLLPATAAAAVPPKVEGPLAPPLAQLARPAVRALGPAAQAQRLGFPRSGPGSLLRRGNRVVVRLRFDHGALAARDDIAAAGGQVIAASRTLQSATAAIPPADLEALGTVPGLASASPLRTPVLYAVNCEGGSVVSEGLGQLHVDEARSAFDLRGKGVTVGVLSDSYNVATEAIPGGPVATKAANDVLTADLPGPAGSCSDQQLPVDVLDEGRAGQGEDEGRAMLQIVHDLAPHAQLAFATAFQSEESFAENIERLARPVSEGGAGADVIVDDVGWFEEPFFQDGPVAAAIDKVTSEGVTYLTAAGNDNLFDEEGNEIASWEAPKYRDAGSCPETVAKLPGFNGKHCMDFDPGAGTDTTFGITVEAGETLIVDLQWGEAWNGVATDLDAFLLSKEGKLLTTSAEENTGLTGDQRPVEILGWENNSASAKTVQVAINRFSGVLDPRLKFVLLENGGGVSATEYPESSEGDVVGPTVTGHAGAASAISVAAVPFNDSSEPEFYSSRGPVVHLFEPVEAPLPAAPLVGAPETIAKPDVAATDCGVTTFFASFVGGKWRFCGTSAAAPHAAAVAALLRQAEPSLSADGLREALTETADPVGAFGPEAVGGGLVNAFNALGSLPGPLEGGDGPSEIVPPLEVPATGGGQPSPTVAPTPTLAPSTSFLKHPRKLVKTPSKTARVAFGFGSDQAGVTFRCQIDAGPLRACGARIAHRFGLGAHSVKVVAVSSAGLADPTPAAFRFRVKHVG
jgi:hypothetical protein